ncbi:aminopeptidase [Candidatus Marinamargulisbacteria bacterium SCGC AG-343-K17]|nr:aminopeptidase [Candidatus Marinamargulisbacteria bacterium SCGC AG-343-K17]
MIKVSSKLNQKNHVVVFVHDKTSGKKVQSAVSNDLANLYQSYKKAKKIKENAFHVIQTGPDPSSPHFVVVNLGKKASVVQFRSLAANVVRHFSDESHVQWVNVESISDWELHLAQVIPMSSYQMPNQKSDKKKASQTQHVILSKEKTSVNEGDIVGEAVNKARTFANSPANVLTTSNFVKEIKSLFKSDKRYSVTVLDESQLKKKKMNALLGVGQGSKYPSYLVDITYKGGSGDAIALVGKGVMFDTGGISIKPSRNMKEMKGDMGGAAAVVGAAWAAGQLNLKRSVSFIVPIVENMVSSEAQRPGDVVVASNGKSIEITNTDAEGRLILADALVYAAKKKVSCILDIATLTGASIIALGPYAISVMGNHQSLVDQLLQSSLGYNERCWQLPLFDEYKDLLKSDVADLLNANEGREAGTITAAKFLEQFVDDVPWAHLDIASTMSSSSTKGDQVKGMTGAGTRALISFMKQYKS